MGTKGKRIRYTEKLHAHRLELMLNREDVCDRCPAIPANALCGHFMMSEYWKATYTEIPCRVCRLFVITRTSREERDISLINEFVETWEEIVGEIPCPCSFLRDPIKSSLKAIAQYRKEV